MHISTTVAQGAKPVKIDGSCHCGKVKYVAEVDPSRVVICHCTDCQTLSGGAFRTVVQTKPATFSLLSGILKSYVKIGESGNPREQTFCPECGTPIYSSPIVPGEKAVGLRVGTIHQRNLLVPTDQYWYRSAQAWLEDLPRIARRAAQPVFESKGEFGDS
jgi:hypothetical protein